MLKQSPDSIQHNFDLQTSPNGLIVAESRANHSYDKHQHSEPEPDLGPVKTRGLGYTEIELGGKPFIIAERLQSGTPSTDPEDTEPGSTTTSTTGPKGPKPPKETKTDDPDDDDKSPKGKPEKPPTPEWSWAKVTARRLQFGEPDADGLVRTGIECSTKGDRLPWMEADATAHPDREIIMSSKDGSVLFVWGNDVSFWRGQPNGTLKLEQETTLAETEHLPDGELGESWTLEGWDQEADINLNELTRAVFKTGIREASEVAATSKFTKLDRDPFEVMKTNLKRVHLERKIQRELAEQAASDQADKKEKEEEPSEGRWSRLRGAIGRIGILSRSPTAAELMEREGLIPEKDPNDDSADETPVEDPTQVRPPQPSPRSEPVPAPPTRPATSPRPPEAARPGSSTTSTRRSPTGGSSLNGATLVRGARPVVNIPVSALPGRGTTNGAEEDETSDSDKVAEQLRNWVNEP